MRFARPHYRNGEIFCWLSNTGHWPDTGGSVPGGFSASATAVEQEGLRLPPVKLFKRGRMDEEIYAIICSNIRVADQRIGADRAAMRQILDDLEAALDDLVGFLPAQIDDEADAAGIVLTHRIIQSPGHAPQPLTIGRRRAVLAGRRTHWGAVHCRSLRHRRPRIPRRSTIPGIRSRRSDCPSDGRGENGWTPCTNTRHASSRRKHVHFTGAQRHAQLARRTICVRAA